MTWGIWTKATIVYAGIKRLLTRTLDLHLPLGKTLILAVIYLLFIFGIAESLLRMDAVQARLFAPSVGAIHRTFEIKLFLLDRYTRQFGPPNCFLVGSSVVNSGLDPALLEVALPQEDGEAVTCFNFGLQGIPASGTAEISAYLVERYHPRWLIYGATARDFSANFSNQSNWLNFNPWFDYRMGKFSFVGWLTDHSMAYRYLLALRGWPAPEFLDDFAKQQVEFDSFTPAGFHQADRVAEDLDQPPDPKTDEAGVYEYAIDTEEFNGLKRIAGLQNDGVRVVVVEMPLHPSYLGYFKRGLEDYHIFLAALQPYLANHDVPFIRAPEFGFIPDSDWQNRNHLNLAGAQRYSDWLAGQLLQEP